MVSNKVGKTVFVIGAALFVLLFLLAMGSSSLAAPTRPQPADGFTNFLPYISSNSTAPPPQPTPTSTPTTTPDPVVILPNHSTYASSIGTMYVVGEIKNNSQDYLRFVKLTVNVFDKDGKLLGSYSPSVSVSVVNPGETACFKAFLDEPAGWNHYGFSDLSYMTGGEPLTDLVIVNHNGIYKPEIFGQYIVNGQIRNESSQTIKYAKGVGTIYDAANTVIGCGTAFVDGYHLNPGQTSSFKITFGVRDYKDFDSYKIEVSGTPQ